MQYEAGARTISVVDFAKVVLKGEVLADATTDGLLREIRDLLVPISEYYRPGYEAAKAEAREKLKKAVAEMVSSPRRKAAWTLADGSRTQRQISQQSKLDEGSTSKLFKALREIGAVIDTPNPTKQLELD